MRRQSVSCRRSQPLMQLFTFRGNREDKERANERTNWLFCFLFCSSVQEAGGRGRIREVTDDGKHDVVENRKKCCAVEGGE